MLPTKVIDQIGISIGDEYVELKYGEWVFKLGLDQNGYPDFPESVKKELPLNIPQTVISAMATMRADGRKQAQIDVDILHEYWCAELMGTGTCSCDPVFWDSNDTEVDIQTTTCGYGKLTCRVCGESSTGEVVSGIYISKDTMLWEINWINGHKRTYRCVSSTTFICEDCEINFWQPRKISKVIDDSSPDSKY
jgi:hypothetical protein